MSPIIRLFPFFLLFLLPACATPHATESRSALRHTDSLRLVRQDSLTRTCALHLTTGRLLRIDEAVFSAPDSAGRQHITHLRRLTSEATSHAHAATVTRQQSATLATASSTTTAQTHQRRTPKARRPLLPRWLLLSGLACAGIFLYVRKRVSIR